MKLVNNLCRCLFIAGCVLFVSACDSDSTSQNPSTGTPSTEAESTAPGTQTEDNSNNSETNTSENNSGTNTDNSDSNDGSGMLPAKFGTEPCSEFAFTACGGDVVGSWRVDQMCIAMPEGMEPDDIGAPSDPNCPSQESGMTMTMTGSELTFNADNSYSHQLQFSMDVAVWRPLSCEEVDSCAELAQQRNSENTNGMEGEPSEDDEETGDMNRSMSWTCETKADGCLCLGQSPMPPSTENGTYTIAGTTLIMEENSQAAPAEDAPGDTEVDDEGGAPEFEFCVEDNTMRFMATPDGGEMHLVLSAQ